MPERSVGAIIRARRIELGLTQEQLVEQINDDGGQLTQADISRIETGRIRLPSPERMQRIANALHLSLGDLLAAATGVSEDGQILSDYTGMLDEADNPPVAIKPDNQEALVAAWQAFSERAQATPDIRPVTLANWRRSRQLGDDPDDPSFSFLSEDELAARRRADRTLVQLARPVMEHLSFALGDISHIVTLADSDGWVLEMRGTPDDFGGRERGIAVGSSLAEERAGTNSIGTALALERPALVFGREHYVSACDGLAGLGVPIRNRGQIVGVMGVAVTMEHARPERLSILQTVVAGIEAALESLASLATADSAPRQMSNGGEALVDRAEQAASRLLQTLLDRQEEALGSLPTGAERERFTSLVHELEHLVPGWSRLYQSMASIEQYRATDQMLHGADETHPHDDDWKSPSIYRRLLDHLPQAVIVTDPDGTIHYWNTYAERLYGWKADEVVGRSVLEVTVENAWEWREQATAILNQLHAGQTWSGEFRVRRQDGSTFTARVEDAPVLDEDGNLVAIIGLSQAITAPQASLTP